jgi:hypothetical protein
MSFRDESQTSNEGEDGLRDIHPLNLEQAEIRLHDCRVRHPLVELPVAEMAGVAIVAASQQKSQS